MCLPNTVLLPILYNPWTNFNVSQGQTKAGCNLWGQKGASHSKTNCLWFRCLFYFLARSLSFEPKIPVYSYHILHQSSHSLLFMTDTSHPAVSSYKHHLALSGDISTDILSALVLDLLLINWFLINIGC